MKSSSSPCVRMCSSHPPMASALATRAAVATDVGMAAGETRPVPSTDHEMVVPLDVPLVGVRIPLVHRTRHHIHALVGEVSNVAFDIVRVDPTVIVRFKDYVGSRHHEVGGSWPWWCRESPGTAHGPGTHGSTCRWVWAASCRERTDQRSALRPAGESELRDHPGAKQRMDNGPAVEQTDSDRGVVPAHVLSSGPELRE